jgi:hypothetical protein
MILATSLGTHKYSMQLVMYIGNDFVAAVSVNNEQLAQPGYIGKIKRQLKSEYIALLQETSDKADFLLVDALEKRTAD